MAEHLFRLEGMPFLFFCICLAGILDDHTNISRMYVTLPTKRPPHLLWWSCQRSRAHGSPMAPRTCQWSDDDPLAPPIRREFYEAPRLLPIQFQFTPQGKCLSSRRSR